MKKALFLGGLFVLLALSTLYANDPMFNQPYDAASPNLYTSTYDSALSINWEVADNFNGLTMPITKVVFYGSPIIYSGGTWTPSTFSATESFTIRFYSFVALGTEPAWATPVASYSVTATATYMEDITWAAYGIYKLEANLPAPLDLANGWFSAQLNEATSTGAWYLTVESATGDDVSYQYEGAKSNSDMAGVHSPASGNPKGVLAKDMAFALYGASGYQFEVNAYDFVWYLSSGYSFPNNVPAFLDPNDLQAEILLNGSSFTPRVYTPYVFGATGNEPFETGTYSLLREDIQSGYLKTSHLLRSLPTMLLISWGLVALS